MYNNFTHLESTGRQKALLVAVQFPDRQKQETENHLAELASLAETMGAETVRTVTVPLKKINPRFLVGSGKAEELAEIADSLETDLIIFDEELSPAQQRNLEKLTGICVIDRHEVILEIFADRASTREAVLQVGLARMEYSLPRLTRAWTHLSRQRGGQKGTRGEGETQLEVDRRIVLNKISRLKKELDKVRRHRDTLRKQRSSVPVPSAAIGGYTNAGKSSLMNLLTNAEGLVEDKLFATLDPTTRRITLPGGQAVLLTDTVGFIRKLPHDLVDAFKSTLEETVLADLLINVIDISSSEMEEQYRTTMEVLEDIKAVGKPVITVFNKTDLLEPNEDTGSLAADYPETVFISAVNGNGIDELIRKIEEIFNRRMTEVDLLVPADRFDVVSIIHREGKIISEKYTEEGTELKALLTDKLANLLQDFIRG